jgi:prophage regulatory protein
MPAKKFLTTTADPYWFSKLPPEGYVREDQFLRSNRNPQPLIPVPSSTWWRWVRNGNAPKPVKLGPSVTAWRVGDLRDWLSKTEAA